MGLFDLNKKLSLNLKVLVPALVLGFGLYIAQGFIIINQVKEIRSEEFTKQIDAVTESITTYSSFWANTEKFNTDGLKKLADGFDSIHSVKVLNKDGKELANYKSEAGLEILKSKTQNLRDANGTTAGSVSINFHNNDHNITSTIVNSAAPFSFVGFVLYAFILYYLIGVSINKIYSNIEKLANYVSSLSKAGDEILNKVSIVTNNATDESAAVQETVSTLEEITSMVNKTMERVNLSSKVSQKSQEAATTGRKTVRETVNTMEIIKDSNEKFVQEIESSNEKLSEIVEVILNIESKTKVINDIVFQTKLLSFNASVEAARAGEHGKGFSVVAEEVGNLARMSGIAAKEISDMLNESVNKVTEITETSKEKIQTLVSENQHHMEVGVQMVQRSGDGLDDIVSNVDEVNEMNSDVLVAQKEQAEGIDNISTAMSHLDETIQLNVKTANQTVEKVEEFKRNVEELNEIVNTIEFQIFGDKKPGLKGKAFDELTFVSEVPDGEAIDEPKEAVENSNVVKFTPPAPVEKSAPAPVQVKKVSGGSDYPDANDPRFDEI